MTQENSTEEYCFHAYAVERALGEYIDPVGQDVVQHVVQHGDGAGLLIKLRLQWTTRISGRTGGQKRVK
jgi:hypothetical protein